MFKCRDHRGSLAASMETVIQLPDLAALKAHVGRGDLTVSPYGGPDHRIGWEDVHIVTCADGVLGFTDGSVTNDGVMSFDRIQPFDVACPICGALPGLPCLKKRGGIRHACHMARWVDSKRKMKPKKRRRITSPTATRLSVVKR